ncbi:MAG: YceI family protein [Armatimonadetes bacterium]|nr:YceI family protein [Armatimonadota bacterium]
MKVTLALSILALAAVGFRMADVPQKFDMADPKGVCGLSFTIDSPLEPISGTSSAVSGEILFNKANPALSTGKIIVQTSTVRTLSDPLTQAMQQDWCLDPAKYPTIEFSVTKIANVKKQKNGSLAVKVTGDFYLHGVTKSITVDANVTKLADKIQVRGGMPGTKGDLLMVRSTFQINRRDFNIAKDLSSEVIGDTVEVKLAAVGVSPK